MPHHRHGVLLGVSAYLLWGLFPLYWPLLEPAAPAEILAHRVVWSLVAVLALVAARRRWQAFRALGARQLFILAGASVVIAVNWLTYIYGVNSEQVVETSLGYFINPLVTVLLGVMVLRERLRPAQWAAVGVAGAAVLVLTIDYGRPPWIALTLAFSFALYGLFKKTAHVGAVEGLTVETAILLLPAAGFLIALEARGTGTLGHVSAGHDLLLLGAGVVTAIPLLLFAGAARRVPLSTVGLLQYIAPVLQLALGVLVFREPMPAARLLGFALVWAALAMLAVDGLRHRRRQVRTARSLRLEVPSEVGPKALGRPWPGDHAVPNADARDTRHGGAPAALDAG